MWRKDFRVSKNKSGLADKAIFHLSVRVAWHDNRWNGAVCNAPSKNSFCVALDRIRAERDDDRQDELAGRFWGDLSREDLPPCVAESAGFMNEREWTRTVDHPYRTITKAAATHGHLRPTRIKVPHYSTFAVPFAWMLRENQAALDEALASPLPPDEEPPFASPWVFGRARQEAITNLMFDRLTPERSLVFFYCKEGQPLGDTISRLLVGVGRITTVGKVQRYESGKTETYPLWDRIIRHSIRPDGADGLLLPYHEYLDPTGDPVEDQRRAGLLPEIAVAADPRQTRSFSYAAEHVNPDVALSTLTRFLAAVRTIREHGIAKGPWEEREEWLNEQIAYAWKDRGAFPGVGSALEALGMRLGTALSLDLISSGMVKSEDDPWTVVDAVLRGTENPPLPAYKADLESVWRTWAGLSDERRALLVLLSRFDLSPPQAKRLFDQAQRNRSTISQVSDAELLANPYRIAEVDLGDGREPLINVGVVDRGLMPDSTVAAKHPVPEPSAVRLPGDARRVRAALVSVLRQASEQGDSLLSKAETLDRVGALDLSRDCEVGADWVAANRTVLEGVIEPVEVLSPDGEKSIPALQLAELHQREGRLRKVLRARADKALAPLGEDWPRRLKEAIREAGGSVDEANPRHVDALREQAEALERITTRKLSVLTGRAGTGKTSVLGALLKCPALVRDGVLLLAPTGKARVRLGNAAGADAMTIAQFLYRCKRYDGPRQRPLFIGEKYRGEKTVVIDECSMLTMDDLLAVLEALDLAHVQRVILVGDPNQLPPIGVGRPFADFVASLEHSAESSEEAARKLAGALGRLTVEVRATAGAPSDTLKLASWFTREPQPVNADEVLSELELGAGFNDLELCFWKTEDDLHRRFLEQFEKHLGLSGPGDIEGFNRRLGINEKGFVPSERPDGAESFQILSPVRMHTYGVRELNRWVQGRFRGKELERAREQWGLKLGDEEIVVRDKVIQVRNQRRTAYSFTEKKEVEVYLANGEVGVTSFAKGKFMNVAFANRPGISVGYSNGRDFPGGSGVLELAYALTVHKAQGSEFKVVFVVLPKNCRLISRELLYTALTRSRDRLVLLIEGDDASGLYDLTRPEKSETARRNTNLFQSAVRQGAAEAPYAQHLIHRTEKGHMVRSKSELVIANMLYRMGVEYEYERRYDGMSALGRRWPDFSFIDPAGELIVWEHLGMMTRDDYRRDWERKREWYEKNGFVMGENLFTTEDDEHGGLDSRTVREVAERIQSLI